jgi:hypothetical protein
MAVFAPLHQLVSNVFDSCTMADLHGVANQGGFLQSMLVDKSCDVVRHGDIIMARVMGGVTMIA